MAPTRIRKRKYSRNGCKECKRRRIKCDEEFPECHNCSRLSKTCVYDSAIIPTNADKSAGALRVQIYLAFDHDPKRTPTRTAKTESRDFAALFPTFPPFPQTSSLPKEYAKELEAAEIPEDLVVAENTETTEIAEVTEAPLQEVLGPHTSAENEFQSQDMLGLFHRASDLVNDMNEFLALGNENDPAFDSNPSAEISTTTVSASSPGALFSTALIPSDFSEYDVCLEPHANPSLNRLMERLLLSNTELIQKCVLEHTLTEPHVGYLKTLTTTDLSYHVLPYASLIESNGGVKLLLIYLAKCTYLLSALLAMSATFQFNQTRKPRHDVARRIYTARCIKALSDAFAEYSSFSDVLLFASNIESLLLTILVLSSCFTATRHSISDNYSNQWQTHLKGARDLLIDYSQRVRLPDAAYMTSGLAFAKCWFFAIESSSVLHTLLGRPFLQVTDRVISRDDLHDAFPAIGRNPEYEVWLDTGHTEANANAHYHEALKRAGLICKTQSGADFNLFWGYTSTAVRLIVTLDSIRYSLQQRRMPRAPIRWAIHLVSLIDLLLADTVIPGVVFPTFEVIRHKQGEVDTGGATDPQKVKEELCLCYGLPNACLSSEIDENGSIRTYSWFDASNQFFGCYMYLRVLTSKQFLALPRTHPQVQTLLQTIFEGFFFIKRKDLPLYGNPDGPRIVLQSENFYLSSTTFDYHCIMFQSIFRHISGVVVEDQDFEKIELFFMGLVKLGNGSALSFLDNVTKFKELRRQNRENNPGLVDDEVYVSFLADIPFA